MESTLFPQVAIAIDLFILKGQWVESNIVGRKDPWQTR